MNEDIKSYIDQRDTVVEQNIKLWILSSAIVQLVALAPIVFFMGGIYQSMDNSVEFAKVQAVQLTAIGRQVERTHLQHQELRKWAAGKGFQGTIPDVWAEGEK